MRGRLRGFLTLSAFVSYRCSTVFFYDCCSCSISGNNNKRGALTRKTPSRRRKLQGGRDLGRQTCLHTYPAVCVSIGLCVNRKPEAGVVHNPFTGFLWSAYRGNGASVRCVRPTCQYQRIVVMVVLPLGGHRPPPLRASGARSWRCNGAAIAAVLTGMAG